MRRALFWRRSAVLVLAVGLAIATGCGPSPATLSGKVTYKGSALKGGSVTLIPDGGGESFSATIQEDGTYKFDQLKSGKFKVCVDTSGLKPQRSYVPGKFAPKGGKIKNEPPPSANIPAEANYKMVSPESAAEAARRYVAIPTEYADPKTTKLSLEVKAGANTYDITLD